MNLQQNESEQVISVTHLCFHSDQTDPTESSSMQSPERASLQCFGADRFKTVSQWCVYVMTAPALLLPKQNYLKMNFTKPLNSPY